MDVSFNISENFRTELYLFCARSAPDFDFQLPIALHTNQTRHSTQITNNSDTRNELDALRMQIRTQTYTLDEFGDAIHT